MVDIQFHKKPDVETNKFAAELLALHDPDSIAAKLDHTDFNKVAVIKQMEAQQTNLGENLPPLVIAGIAEHLAHEARDRKNISAEYNVMNLFDKQGVAAQLEKVKGLIIHEGTDRTLQSVEMRTSDDVTQSVYQPPSESGRKAADVGKKAEDAGKKVIKKLNPFGHSDDKD